MRSMKLDIIKSIIDYKLNTGQEYASNKNNVINKKI